MKRNPLRPRNLAHLRELVDTIEARFSGMLLHEQIDEDTIFLIKAIRQLSNGAFHEEIGIRLQNRDFLEAYGDHSIGEEPWK